MKINQVVVCLTLITIVELITVHSMFSLWLWIGYGVYKLIKYLVSSIIDES